MEETGSLSKTIMLKHPVCGFLQVYEAYGQTECTAGCTYTTPGDWTSGEPPSVITRWSCHPRRHGRRYCRGVKGVVG